MAWGKQTNIIPTKTITPTIIIIKLNLNSHKKWDSQELSLKKRIQAITSVSNGNNLVLIVVQIFHSVTPIDCNNNEIGISFILETVTKNNSQK